MKNRIFEGYVHEVLGKLAEDTQFGKKAHTFETKDERTERRRCEDIARVERGYYQRHPDMYRLFKENTK